MNPAGTSLQGYITIASSTKNRKAERPLNDRMFFTFGSYNAGFRTIVRAQEVCEEIGLNENLWRSIKTVAPKVPGWRHRETVGYVDKIDEMLHPILK